MRHALAVSAMAATVLACGKEKHEAGPGIPVRLSVVQEAGGPGGVRYSASVEPRAQVDVAFKANGYVESIRQVRGADGRMRNLQQGDNVSAGMVLAQIRDQEYRDQLHRAEANLAKARATLQKGTEDFRRASNLKETNSITGTDYDSAREEYESALAAVEAARAQVDEAKINLSYTRLAAPMGGVILQRKIEVGSLVGPGTTAFVLADVTSVKVVFGLPDVMLGSVALGRKIGVSTVSIPGKTFMGTVTAIAPSADQSTRVSQVEVTVPNDKGELRDGMIASLEVPGGPPGPGTVSAAVAVPLAAVVPGKDSSGYAVYVVADSGGGSVARLRPVELGQVAGTSIVVTSGLASGDRVIVSGATLVRDGAAVRPLP